MAAMHSSGVWTWPHETLLVKAKTHGKVVYHMTFAGAKGQVHAPVNPTRVALERGRSRMNQQSHASLPPLQPRNVSSLHPCVTLERAAAAMSALPEPPRWSLGDVSLPAWTER